MSENRLDSVRGWALRNEPFFRLGEFLVVLAFGAVLTAIVSYVQIQIASKQLEVSAKELEHIELQTKLAKAALSPRFDFSMDDSDGLFLSTLKVKCDKETVDDLRANAILFVESNQETANPRRIAFTDFFQLNTTDVVGSRGECSLATWRTWNNTALFKFLVAADTQGNLHPPFVASLTDVAGDSTRTIYLYVELDYFNVAREKVIERFVMQYPTRRVRPVIEKPRFDKVCKVADFKRGNEGTLPYEWSLVELCEEIDRVMPARKDEVAVAKTGGVPSDPN